jgi:hypothetical protein
MAGELHLLGIEVQHHQPVSSCAVDAEIDASNAVQRACFSAAPKECIDNTTARRRF